MILFRHGVAPPTLPLHGINEGWEKCVAFLGNAAAIYWLRTMWGNVPVIEKAWIKSPSNLSPSVEALVLRTGMRRKVTTIRAAGVERLPSALSALAGTVYNVQYPAC